MEILIRSIWPIDGTLSGQDIMANKSYPILPWSPELQFRIILRTWFFFFRGRGLFISLHRILSSADEAKFLLINSLGIFDEQFFGETGLCKRRSLHNHRTSLNVSFSDFIIKNSRRTLRTCRRSFILFGVSEVLQPNMFNIQRIILKEINASLILHFFFGEFRFSLDILFWYSSYIQHINWTFFI